MCGRLTGGTRRGSLCASVQPTRSCRVRYALWASWGPSRAVPRGRGARREVEMAAHCQGYRWGRTGREVASTTCVARPARMPGRVREGVRHRHCRLYARASNDDGDGARVDGRAAADAVQGEWLSFIAPGPALLDLSQPSVIASSLPRRRRPGSALQHQRAPDRQPGRGGDGVR